MTINGAVQADPWNVASVLVDTNEIQKYYTNVYSLTILLIVIGYQFSWQHFSILRACTCRRKSIDMRYNVYDPPRHENQFNKYLLAVDESYYSKYRRKCR